MMELGTGSLMGDEDMPSKWKIYQEKVKTRQTSHWDWDCMTSAQIDDAIRASRETKDRLPSSGKSSLAQSWQNLLRRLRWFFPADK
jgi:outer membrane protease